MLAFTGLRELLMKTIHLLPVTLFLILVASISYAKNLEKSIIGKWRHLEVGETFQFFEGMTAMFSEPTGQSFVGEYKILNNETIKMKFEGMFGYNPTFIFQIYIKGDMLTMKNLNNGETNKYRKITGKYIIHKSRYGFVIKHPHTWVAQRSHTGNIVLFIKSPKEQAFDFQENINISIKSLSSHQMTLDEVTEEELNSFKSGDNPIKDMVFHEEGPTTLAGQDAYKVVFSGRMQVLDLKWLQIWTVKNNKRYEITYAAQQDKYEKYLGMVREMIKSFEIQ